MASVHNHETDIDAEELMNGVVRPTGPMTEAEFMAWCDEDVKAEWVDGEVIIMSPSSFRHVDLAGLLLRILADFVEDHDLGKVVGPEFMIRLGAQRRIRVPDLLFIAKDRFGLIRKNHLEGAPDLAIEIVSPDSESRDRVDKYADYEAGGVREYWMIDPDEEELSVYALDPEGRFQKLADNAGRIDSTVIPGFFLRAEWLWQSPLPGKRNILRTLGLDA